MRLDHHRVLAFDIGETICMEQVLDGMTIDGASDVIIYGSDERLIPVSGSHGRRCEGPHYFRICDTGSRRVRITGHKNVRDYTFEEVT